MELSRMQDIAGTRFVVDDLSDQNRARDEICAFYAGIGCVTRVTDRRADPRFGYRAVHVIVTMDSVPVEIQIRTELQDSWAQIIERLADRRGRGIRYGEEPEDPDRLIYSAGSLAGTRRDTVGTLMKLSDEMYSLETARNHLKVNMAMTSIISKLTAKKIFRGSKHRRARRVLRRPIPDSSFPAREALAQQLSTWPAEQLDEATRIILAAGNDITGSQLMRLGKVTAEGVGRQMVEAHAQIRASGKESGIYCEQ